MNHVKRSLSVDPADNHVVTILVERDEALKRERGQLHEAIAATFHHRLRPWYMKRQLKPLAPRILDFQKRALDWENDMRRFLALPRLVTAGGEESGIAFLHWMAELRDRANLSMHYTRLLEQNYNHAWERFYGARSLVISWAGIVLSLAGLIISLLRNG